MGFRSTADRYDTAGGSLADTGASPTAWDLFRYSSNPTGTGILRDITADTRQKYFSLDGGVTPYNDGTAATFSTGTTFGDGSQASHWKDNLGIGIMDPTAANGEFLTITSRDWTALDVIGWNLNLAAIPEPSTLALLVLGGISRVSAAARGRRKKRQATEQ